MSSISLVLSIPEYAGMATEDAFETATPCVITYSMDASEPLPVSHSLSVSEEPSRGV